MGSQFFTAVGAFVGTFLGIWIAETSGTGKHSDVQVGQGFFGTSVIGGDLVIPMTAGGFLYIASVSVVPELLAESRSGWQALKEYAAMGFGVFCMVSRVDGLESQGSRCRLMFRPSLRGTSRGREVDGASSARSSRERWCIGLDGQ